MTVPGQTDSPATDRVYNCSVTALTISSLPPHTYYSVCAVLVAGQAEQDRQCLILHGGAVVRYHTRSVLSLLLTLIFLSLG